MPQIIGINKSGAPIGTIKSYSGASAPQNFLLCYGQAISRTTYAALFAIIGTTYGVGDGSTTFNLPDLRGIFIRGAGSQTFGSVNYSGTLGTKQNDQFQTHGHNISDPGHSHTISLVNQGSPTRNFTTLGTDTHVTIPTGNTNNSITNISVTTPNSGRTGSETYPANISLNYIIAYI